MNFISLLSNAIKKAGKQETLATDLGLSPSGLSRRINGETGWAEKDINKLLEYTDCQFASLYETEKKIKVLQDTITILLMGLRVLVWVNLYLLEHRGKDFQSKIFLIS